MAEPRYRYGGDSAIGALLLPERREILRDEQNQFIGYDDQGNAIVQTIPAQYGESEVDVSYSPVVRGAKKTLSFIRDAFSGDPERVGSAADRAETAIRGVMGGLTDYASSQYEAGMAGGTIYDPETGQITEFDPALVMGGSGAGKSLPRSALDMSDAARMQRAQELGFDTSRPLYHYTDKLEDGGEFNRLAVSPDNVQTKLGRGIYTSPNNQYGDRYVRQQREMSGAYGENARAIPLYARGNLATDVDFDAAMRAARENLGIQGRRVPDRESKLRLSNEIRSEAQRLLKDQGFSGIQFMDEVMIFDPKDVRSVNARFDPAMSNSDMIMYSGGGRQGTAVAGGSALHDLKMRAVNGDESAIAELMTIEGLDRDNVLRRAQNAASRYEGLSQEEYAQIVRDRRPVRLGQSTEERMQRSSEQGYSGPYYTGASRLDRLLQENEILPERATSGPMPFFTTDPELASSYAKNKRDTSLELNDNKEAFTVNPVDLNLPKDREITVEDSWNYLDPDKKAEILSKAERIGYEDLDNFEGKFVLHPEGVKGLPSSKDHFDYIMRTEAKGNPLAALRELWLDSGNLYDKEELMEVIYKLSGFPARISQINAPWTEASGVLPVMMRLKNPIDTTNTDSLKQTVIPALREAFSDPKYNVKSEAFGVDQWDKNTRFTPKEWVEQLAEDVSKGENSYVWTSIPDEVTLQLEKLGFDSIIDVSGKGGGDIKEKVVIPFKPNQVRSVNAEFDPEKIDSADLLSSRQSERQMSALRGIA